MARDIDWIAIERDYRAGIKSNVQIANEHGVTETAIRKRAKKYEWVKDLQNSIRDLAAKMVREKEVRDRFETQADNTIELEDAKVVEENASIQAEVIRSHRKDIGKARIVARMLIEQLEIAVLNPEQLEEFAIIRATVGSAEDGNEELNAKLLSFYTKIMELPNQASTMERLVNSLGKLVDLERKVFNIDADDNGGQTLESFLSGLD